MVGRELVAVAKACNKKLKLVHVRGARITLGTVLDVRSACWGGATSDDIVVVLYRCPPLLEVMSTDGRVLHFQASGATLTFKFPQFLTKSRVFHLCIGQSITHNN